MMDSILPLDSNTTAVIDIDTGEMVGTSTMVDNCPEGVSPELWKQWSDEVSHKNDPFLYQLKRAEQGQNVGLGNGLEHVNRYIYGTHKARYYLLGGESGAGKTTIGDFMFVINAWLSAKKLGRRIKIFYCSFEIGKTEKLYRWCSYFIFAKYNVQLPSDYLQGRIQGKPPTKEHVRMTLEAYSVVSDMLKDVVIMHDTFHPTKIFEGMIEAHFEKEGVVTRVAGKDKKSKGYVTGYVEKDPDLISMLVIDHLALTGSEMGLNTKDIMDKMSKYAIVLRNLFYCTVVFYQQFSTDMMAAYRGMVGKKSEATIAPQRLDFGDSKATFRDADVVFGAVKPQKDMKTWNGYNLSSDEGFGDSFTVLYNMKNRYGPSNRQSPLLVDGTVGYVYDIPLTPLNPMAMQPWIDKAKQIEQLCQVFSPQNQ